MSQFRDPLYRRLHFPPEIISAAVWLYFRFPLSLRMAEELLAVRGICVSYETVRQWAHKFGREFAERIRRRAPERASNAIERPHEELKRRNKTQTVLRGDDTTAMLFWALLPSGQITMRTVAGWQSLAETPSDQPIDLAA